MKDIKFNSENGSCPYFVHEDYRFFIQDNKVGNKWRYSLYVKDMKSDNLVFADKKEATKYVMSIKGIKFVCQSQDLSLYETINKDYIINKNKVNIKNKPEFVALDFDSFLECLNFAKKYVEEFIRKNDRQMMMF